MARERDDITEIGRSARDMGRVDGTLSGSTEPIPIPERTAFAMDFRTARADICFCKSDFALPDPLLGFVRKVYRCKNHITHRKRSITTDLAVSLTALSASSRHATREGTYWRNNSPWFLVI